MRGCSARTPDRDAHGVLAVYGCSARERASGIRRGSRQWRRPSQRDPRRLQASGVEVQADEDTEDRYYNEWLLLSEFLSYIPGVLAYDPTLGEWLGQSATGSG
jgi:hypothetical protein